MAKITTGIELNGILTIRDYKGILDESTDYEKLLQLGNEVIDSTSEEELESALLDALAHTDAIKLKSSKYIKDIKTAVKLYNAYVAILDVSDSLDSEDLITAFNVLEPLVVKYGSDLKKMVEKMHAKYSAMP